MKILGPITESALQNRIAITYSTPYGWQDMTYRHFADIVRETKSFFMKFGLKKRDRVVIVAENHAKWLPVFMAAVNYGAIAVPVDGQAPVSRILNILNDSKPRVIITSKQFEEKMTVAFGDINFQCMLVNFYFDLLRVRGDIVPETQLPPPPSPNDPAMIIYTSGTAGAPKGVTHSHFSVLSAIDLSRRIGNLVEGDVILTLLPYSHVFGLVNAALLPYYMGVRNVIGSTYNPVEIMKIITGLGVNYMCLVPRLAEIFLMMAAQTGKRFDFLKVTIGGAACRVDVIEKLRAIGVRVGFGYGMTETCGGICVNYDGPPGSVGKIPEGVTIKLHEPKDGVGEILVQSLTNMIGIFGRPELNRDLWIDGFMRTGDLGRLDENGWLYIMGRLKDVIVPAGGMNVYPDELEERLGPLPFLKEYSVLGIKENGTEAPALVVRLDQEFFTRNGINDPLNYVENEIDRKTADWPAYERFSRIIEVTEPLPRSYSFKVQRNQLAELIKAKQEYEKGVMAGEATEDENLVRRIFEKFKPLIANHLNIPQEELTPSRPLSKYERLDSLGKVALLAYFQQKFNLEVEDVTEKDFATFSSFIKMFLRTNPAERLLQLPLDEKIEEMPVPVPLDYSKEAIMRRQKYVMEKTGADLSVFAGQNYGETEKYRGHIENLFGFASLPIGLVGPLKVNGEFAEGEFFVPLATTEGALVASVSRGAQVITLSGGATTKVLADSLARTPVFMFDSIPEMLVFSEWVKENHARIRQVAESTTRHGRLLDIEQYPVGSVLALRFIYNTGDASGQNMVTIATQKAIDWIRAEYTGTIAECFLECNLSGDKKANGLNFVTNRGKKVIAQARIPFEFVRTYLRTTPEKMQRFFELATLGSFQSHSFGCQGHYSNPLTAIYIACGQDPACAAESATGITHLTICGETVSMSVTLPNIMVGTVGGGTDLPTQRACLEIMGCTGDGSAKKLAEIVAATVLAAELSISASMSAGDFAEAHATYGRRKK